jgi:hypothetical protein
MRFEVGHGSVVEIFTGGFEAEVQAARAWERWHRAYGASFRIVTESGEEYGTLRPGERHGVHGILTERCMECGREFRTLQAGAAMCPGCELLVIGSLYLRHGG